MSSSKHKTFQKALGKVRDRIETCTLRHDHFNEAMADLELGLKGKKNLIFLVGTTGVGKGVLVKTLEHELNLLVKDDRRHLRAISCTAPSPRSGPFSWSGFCIALLEAAFDPFPEDKVNREDSLTRLNREVGFSIQNHSGDRLFNATIRAIADRGVRVIIVNEAENLVPDKKGHGFVKNLRVVRDLGSHVSGDPIAGQKGDCKVVLVSTPDVLEEVAQVSSEIVRRMNKVVLSRYTLGGGVRGTEFQGFRMLVGQLLELFPEEIRPELSRENILDLHLDSLGCIGNLVNWFVDAINLCINEADERLEWRHFEKTALTDAALKHLVDQCEKDEKFIKEWTAKKGCGLARRRAWEAEAKKEAEAIAAAARTAVEESRKSGKRQVGVQKPVRHRMSG